MAAPRTRVSGDTLRSIGDRCYELADQYDATHGDIHARRFVNDDIEASAEDLRAISRGPRS